MFDLTNSSRFIQYLVYAILFIIGQSAAMWGLYYTLPFKNLSMWQAYKMAIPFAWLDWIFMTLAINVGHTYNLVTPTQDTFVLIIVQFTLILIINQLYLKQNIFRSDIIAFFMILIGFCISFFHILSKALGIAVHTDTKLTDTKLTDTNTKLTNNKLMDTKLTDIKESKVHAFTKIKVHNEINGA